MYLIIFVVLLVTPEQIAQQTERNDQILRQFWAQLISTLDNAPDQSMLQDLIVTNLKVIDDEVPDSWVNTDQRVSFTMEHGWADMFDRSFHSDEIGSVVAREYRTE